jgi:predicted nucleic acid-binding protein
MIFVDSSVWIDLFKEIDNEETRKLRNVRSIKDILVGDLVMYEVLRGARSDLHARQLEREFRHFHIEPILSPDIAIKSATNYRTLRSLGVTIRKEADAVIGTYCVQHGHALLHRDRDFRPMVEHLGLVEF